MPWPWAKRDTNEMELDVLDPLDWTIDHVVAFLYRICHSLAASGSRVLLRKNLVNGKVLLNYVGKMLLNNLDKEILGLRALGHRSMMVDVIQHLQQRSVKYQTANSVAIGPSHRGKFMYYLSYHIQSIRPS